ncbi:MAG: nucleotidyltransferase domain-containing protein [Candidatus Woesearchaeota archaeon]
MNNYQDTVNKVVGNLLPNILESKSLHQLALETKLSYVTVHKIIPTLIKKGIIKVEKKGKAHLISIDLEQAPVDDLSSAMVYQRGLILKKYPKLILLLRDLEEALADKFYTLLFFGSKIKGTAKSSSDFDLFFIIPKREEIEDYHKTINKVLRLHTIKLDINIAAIDEFMEMLNQKYTVGRAVFQKNLVLFGTEQYYALVKKYVRTSGYWTSKEVIQGMGFKTCLA